MVNFIPLPYVWILSPIDKILNAIVTDLVNQEHSWFQL